MNNEELNQAAHNLIAEKIGRKEVVQMSWAVKEIINGAGAISGDGVEFYVLCAREHIYGIVKKAVNKYDERAELEENPQLLFEGYDHLRAAYTIQRDNERVLTPLELISDEELRARAQEYRRQSKGLADHADEIDLYLESRKTDAGQKGAA